MKTAMEKSSHAQTATRELTKNDAAALRDHRGVSLSQSSIDNSSAVIAQRMQIENVFGDTIQRQPLEEEEEEPLQGKFVALQRQPLEEEEEEPLQGKLATGTVFQRQPSPNRTGLPDELKAGVENLSGLSLDDVRVHYNSSKPTALQALAYTQGTDIHVAPGQERHLPHEAWHVVQQAQGRVKATMQRKDGIPVNDDEDLEREADDMGLKALTAPMQCQSESDEDEELLIGDAVIQRAPTVTKSAAYRGSDSHYPTIKLDLETHYGLTSHAIEVTNGVHYLQKNGSLYGLASQLFPVFYYDYKLNGGAIMHHEVHIGVVARNTDWSTLITTGNLRDNW